MSRTDRRTAAAACLMSGLGCFLACALLGFPATGGVRFAWALLWAVSSVAGLRFLRLRDRRAKACFGAFGALFVLALALGYRLDAAGQTGVDGLLLSLGTALCLGPAAGWAAFWLDARMTAPPAQPEQPAQPASTAPPAQPAQPAPPAPPAPPPPPAPTASTAPTALTAQPTQPAPPAQPAQPTPPAPPTPPPQPAPPSPRPRVLLPMAVLLLAWTPMLLAFYPGIHAYDTFSQIPEYLSGSFSTHHPLLHTLLTGWLYDLGGLMGSHALGMLFYSVAQMLLLAWALAYGLTYLARLGCPRWVRLALLMLFCLPQISLHALGCTKDIPFAALITVFSVRLHAAVRDPRLLRSRRWVAGTVAAGVFMALFRNNAPYALALLVPFAAALAGRGARLRMTALLAAVLVLGLGAGKGLQLATHAQSGLVNEMLSVPAQQLSRVYVLHGAEDPVGYEIVEFVPYADQYDVWSADRVKLHLKVSRPGELWGFLKFWGRELLHYPVEYIDAFLYQCKGYWFVDDTLFSSRTGAIYLWFYDNLGVEQHSFLPGLRSAMLSLFDQNTYRAYPIVSLLIQPALYTWLALFALACAARRRDRGVAAAALCLLAYLFTVCLGPLVGNRYSFCMMTGAPLLIGLLLAPRAHNLPETGKPVCRR